jgi:methionine-rich copper-binding protein CopC
MIRALKFAQRSALALLAIVMWSSATLAHCFPDKFAPSAASSLNVPPSQVAVHFDNPFNPAGTSVRVLNRDGDLVSGMGAPSSDNRSLTVPLKELSPGQYFVKWRATSQDGDHTMGAYTFTVKGEP